MLLERVIFVATLYLGLTQAFYAWSSPKSKNYLFHATLSSICLTAAVTIALYP